MEPQDASEKALQEIARKLDMILGVLLTQGKSTEESLILLDGLGLDSQTIATLTGVTAGYVRTWKSRRRKKGSTEPE
jgi:DNA-directed RNA polymerase specialized sigma24 family protein